MKKKICKGYGKHKGMGCGEETTIFSHGLCRYCANKAYMSANKGVSNKSGIRTSKRAYTPLKRKPTGEKQLFEKIWNERPHVSEVSGKPLLAKGHKFWHSQFAHILSKGSRPDLRLDANNIVLLTFDEHFIFDNYAYKVRDKEEWKWLFEKQEKLREWVEE